MRLVVEMAATILETVLIFAAVQKICKPKYQGKKQVGLMFLLCVGMIAFVTYLNTLSLVSVTTILISIAYIVFTSGLVTEGGWLLRATACMLVLFFLHMFDNAISFSVGLFLEDAQNVHYSFDSVMHPGTARTICTIVDKGLQSACLLLLYPHLEKFRRISKRDQGFLLVFLTIAYFINVMLVNLIISDSVYLLQIAVILFWVFILLGMIGVLTTVIFSTRYQNEKREKELIAVVNAMQEKNYRQLSMNQSVIARQIHDFNNHLKTLQNLTSENPGAQSYLSSLLQTSYQEMELCRSAAV